MAYKPFKMKGSPMKRNFGVGSPNNLNNFGVGPGGSPWKADDDPDDKSTTDDTDDEKKTDVEEKGGEAAEADKPWVKALKIGTTLLSGGIQGVYGGTRQYPKINYGKKTKETTESPEDKVNNLIDNEDATVNNTNKVNTED